MKSVSLISGEASEHNHEYHTENLYDSRGDKVCCDGAQYPMAWEQLSDDNGKVDHDHGADRADQTGDEQDECECTDRETEFVCQVIGNHAVGCCHVVPCYKKQDTGGKDDDIGCHQDIS